MQKQTLLISGATGFTGRYIITEALKNNFHIIALVRKTSNTTFLKEKGVEIIIVDFLDKSSLINTFLHIKKLIPQLDIIIHHAGVTKAIRREDFIKGNTLITQNFIEALKESDLIPRRFIYTSSLAALGPGNAHNLAPITEEQKPAPVTYYGESKLLAEKLIINSAYIPYIIIRPTAIYGPGDRDTLLLFKSIKKGIETSLTKEKQQLTFIYVEDMARAYMLAALHSGFPKCYHISDGNFYTSTELNDYLKQVLHKHTIKLYIRPGILKVAASFIDKYNTITDSSSILTKNKVNELKAINWKIDSNKIQKELNFKARIDLKTGIELTYHWYKQHDWI